MYSCQSHAKGDPQGFDITSYLDHISYRSIVIIPRMSLYPLRPVVDSKSGQFMSKVSSATPLHRTAHNRQTSVMANAKYYCAQVSYDYRVRVHIAGVDSFLYRDGVNFMK